MAKALVDGLAFSKASHEPQATGGLCVVTTEGRGAAFSVSGHDKHRK